MADMKVHKLPVPNNPSYIHFSNNGHYLLLQCDSRTKKIPIFDLSPYIDSSDLSHVPPQQIPCDTHQTQVNSSVSQINPGFPGRTTSEVCSISPNGHHILQSYTSTRYYSVRNSNLAIMKKVEKKQIKGKEEKVPKNPRLICAQSNELVSPFNESTCPIQSRWLTDDTVYFLQVNQSTPG